MSTAPLAASLLLIPFLCACEAEKSSPQQEATTAPTAVAAQPPAPPPGGSEPVTPVMAPEDTPTPVLPPVSSALAGAPGQATPPVQAGGGGGTGGQGAPAAAGMRGTPEAGGGGAASGGRAVAGGMGSAGEGGQPNGAGAGGMPEPAAMVREGCPEAPPAVEKAPAADRGLAVSKDAYSQLLTRQEPFTGTRGSLPWHLHSPEAVPQSGQALPLLVVLHGGYGREVPDGNIMVDVAQYLLGSQNGLLTEAQRAAFPTYILLPHCRVEEGCVFGSNEWSSAGGAFFQIQSEPSVAGATALELVEHVIANFNVDPQKVYLTGNSMGGGGTWEFAQRRPELFAAVVPVSGHPPTLDSLASIAQAKLPVWAFGAANDNVNPYADTVQAVSSITDGAGCAWLTPLIATPRMTTRYGAAPILSRNCGLGCSAQRNPSAP